MRDSAIDKAFDNVMPEDMVLINTIVDRGLSCLRGVGIEEQLWQLQLDVLLAHADTPLNLEVFAAFEPFNFAHDLMGIYRHLDRTTYKLEGCFLPRCARHEPFEGGAA